MSKFSMSMFFLFLIQITLGQSNLKTNTNCDSEIKFHYLITQNLISKERKQSERFRQIWVFLDEKAFSQENLKILFTYLSKKYPSSNFMDIRVETNWERVPNPDDCEGEGTSGGPDRKDVDDYHWAVFFRSGKDEIFRYNPILKDKSIKTVVLKGKAF